MPTPAHPTMLTLRPTRGTRREGGLSITLKPTGNAEPHSSADTTTNTATTSVSRS